jgi:hypothetical protein
MYPHGPCALSDVRTTHGPRILGQYFAFADAAARDRGVDLRIRWDFDRLLEVSQQNSDNFPAVSPIFNPTYSVLTPDAAFWIEGVDASGTTVVTSAARLCDHGERSLADDLRSLRIFFDRPEPRLAAGERVDVVAPAAEHIRGKVMASGIVWVRPDYRRHGFTRIVPRLARSYALTCWNPSLFWGLIKPEHDEIGLTQAYGSWQMGGRLIIQMPSWVGDVEPFFLWMDREALIKDIAASCGQATTESSRRMETAKTSTSPRARQGISKRS